MYTDEERKIVSIFHPRQLARVDSAVNRNIRFSHYCSAESGVKILEGRSMFLRHSSLMNDFSEVQHGLKLLNRAYVAHGNYLKHVLGNIDPSLPDLVLRSGDSLNDLKYSTYLTSISEHNFRDISEGVYGRLSMWRAYAPKNGVCLVMDNGPFLRRTTAFPDSFATSPVFYLSQGEFNGFLHEIIQSIETNTDYIVANMKPDAIAALVLNVFRSLVQTVKHPAFSEEKEWRIIYTPGLFGPDPRDARLPKENITLRGVPQMVYRIPFRNHPSEGFRGAEIPELLHQVLIGPSTDGTMIALSYKHKLEELGVSDAENKIIPTHIPLRM
jgi:hypothetical protein